MLRETATVRAVFPIFLGLSAFVLCGCPTRAEDDRAERPPLPAAKSAKAESKTPRPATETPKQPTAPPPDPIPEQVPTSELPRAEDVLPPGQVSKGARVAAAKGFRFQVRPELDRIEHPKSHLAFRGNIERFQSKPSEVTVYAYREPFAGDLDALVAREEKSVTSRGGSFDFVRVEIKRAGEWGPARRTSIKVEGVIGMSVLAVHDGYAYVLACETPDKPMAWINVGSDCTITGATFHIDP